MTAQSPLVGTMSELDTGVIEQSPAALCMCSAPDGEIVRYNALAVRLWGRTPDPGERLTGAWRTRFPDGRLMAVHESAMDAVLRGGAPIQDRQMIIERRDGSCVTVRAYVSPLQDDAGRLVGAISAFEDVKADDVRAAAGPVARDRVLVDGRQQLRDKDAESSRAFDSALIGVWDYDLRTRRAVRSVTHDQIYGYTKALQEWTFDTFLDHVAPEYRDRIRTRFENCVTSGEGEFDCRITRADGTPAWIWSRGRVLRDANGAPVRVVGIVMDMTRQRRAELSFEHESLRKDTFVATLAHELRQPLSAMLAAADRPDEPSRRGPRRCHPLGPRQGDVAQAPGGPARDHQRGRAGCGRGGGRTRSWADRRRGRGTDLCRRRSPATAAGALESPPQRGEIYRAWRPDRGGAGDDSV